MRKRYLVMVLPLLVLFLATTSDAWQGRMGGMGDPYGLVADESDFLTHPAKIAKGEGVRFYGDYRFLYTDVVDWDYDIDEYNLGGALTDTIVNNISGHELRHNALLGAGFPLGPGRMGLFFTYAGERGDYDGDHAEGIPPSTFQTREMENRIDDFAFRLLYGLPVGGFKLGGEVQIAYRQEENELYWLGSFDALLNGYDYFYPQYLHPYDSHYWEALFKGSLEGKAGPLDLEFTLRGGFLFAGDNEWYFELQIPPGTLNSGWDLEGDVQGWRIGGDLWARYPLRDGLSLPFLVRVDYQTKTRDGDGPGLGTSIGNTYDYEHEQRDLAITVGGGVDKVFNKTRVAAGIYYNYLQGKEDHLLHEYWPGVIQRRDYTYPDSTEHQVLLRFAGEHEFSPVVALRGGLSFFYGWMDWEREYTYTVIVPVIGSWTTVDGSGHGSHWGIGGSLGGTIRLKPITLEPFLNAGYQQLNLDGDSTFANSGSGIYRLTEEEDTRSEWYIGGGLSVLFDVP